MIICFSGTGNSRYIAEYLSNITGDSVVMLTGTLLTEPEKHILSAAGEKRIIWIFPTHSWGVPPMVANAIRCIGVINGEQSRHYMITTCGDDIGMCHEMWRKLIVKRGWISASAFSVIMPNTYVAFPGFDTDATDIEKSKISAAKSRVEEIAEYILGESVIDNVTQGRMPCIKTRLIYPLFVKNLMSPSRFTVNDDSCIGCGQCALGCPTGNIRIIDGKPNWGDTCTMCLRCYHVCPGHSIEYGRFTKNKKQYRTLIH